MVERRGRQPAFQPLVPCERRGRSRHGRRAPPVEYWVSWRCRASAGRGAADARRGRGRDEVEARAVAADIAALHTATGGAGPRSRS